MNNLRRVERHTPEGWKTCLFRDLVAGDRFRMFHPDGTPVTACRTRFKSTPKSLQVEYIVKASHHEDPDRLTPYQVVIENP